MKRNKLSPNQAKELLKGIRSQRAREYASVEHSFGGKHFKFGILGDTHFGNKWTDKFFLRDVMKQFKKEGIEFVIHTGDLTDGPWQKHRNVLEQYAHGFDNQVQDFVEDFPDIGKPVYVIDGNHDGWYRKGDGGVVGHEIAIRRPDVHYLGYDEGIIEADGIEIMLSHPDDATTYAYSYKAQKFIEAMSKMGESLPDIVLQGHYHKAFYMNAAGTNYYCTATTCRQTPWMRNRKIAADIGAWIIDVHKNSRGISKLTHSFLPFKGPKHKRAIK